MTEEYEMHSDNPEEPGEPVPLVEEYDRQKQQDNSSNATTEMIKAHRALVEQYFIEAGDNAFSPVRYYQRYLQEWHAKHTKWHMENYQGVFYLQRVPSTQPPLQEDMKDLLHHRDLVYLFWILWYAAEGHARHDAPTQYFSLQDLCNQIQEQWQITGKYDVLELDTLESNRKSLIRALKYLVDHRYLELKQGRPEEWIKTKENDDSVYYHFTDLTKLLITSLQVKSIELSKTRVRQLYAAIQPAHLYKLPTKDEPMTRAWRNLLLGPVFLRYDDPEAFTYLRQNASTIEHTLFHTFGWLLEMNGDYACIVYTSTDRPRHAISFNLSAGLDQQILLLCGALRQHVASQTITPNAYGCILTSEEEFRQFHLPVYQDFVERSTTQTVKKTAGQYFVDICHKMRRIGFIRGPDAAGQLLILPTVALYAPVYTQENVKPEQQMEKENSSASENIQPLNLWSEDQELED